VAGLALGGAGVTVVGVGAGQEPDPVALADGVDEGQLGDALGVGRHRPVVLQGVAPAGVDLGRPVVAGVVELLQRQREHRHRHVDPAPTPELRRKGRDAAGVQLRAPGPAGLPLRRRPSLEHATLHAVRRRRLAGFLDSLRPIRPLLATAAVTQPLLGERFDWAWYLVPSRTVARSYVPRPAGPGVWADPGEDAPPRRARGQAALLLPEGPAALHPPPPGRRLQLLCAPGPDRPQGVLGPDPPRGVLRHLPATVRLLSTRRSPPTPNGSCGPSAPSWASRSTRRWWPTSTSTRPASPTGRGPRCCTGR
jgi:hypothetical protein